MALYIHFKDTIIGGEQPTSDYMKIESGLDYQNILYCK